MIVQSCAQVRDVDMNTRFLSFTLLVLLAAFVLGDEPKLEKDAKAGELAEVQKLKLESLTSVTSVAVSPDGRFLYAAAFNPGVITIFKRNIETGEIESDSSVDGRDLRAAVSLRLSRDGNYAVASAFGANAITLFKRDSKSGALELLDVARDGEKGNDGLDFVIDAEFSNDNRYLYTGAAEGVGVFKIEDGNLRFVHLQSADGQLKGLRAVALSPNGQLVYVAAAQSGAVGVLRPDAISGKLEVVQVLRDEQEGVHALEGAFRIACSPSGEHVYVSSGRFGGDQAVSVFEAQADGKLKLLEEHVNGVGDLKDFNGGNDLAVSPDGSRLYALATLSDRIARFARDLKTGRLTFFGSQLAGDYAVPGCPGLCFSPDGRFLYIADEAANSILVMKVP